MRLLDLTLLIQRRRRQTAVRQQSFQKRFNRAALGLAASAGLLLAAGLLWLGYNYAQLTADLPSLNLLPELLDRQTGLLLQPTRIYDRRGETLLLTLENPGIPRTYLGIDPQQEDSFAPILVQTTISLNDPGFWQHPGFQWRQLTSPEPATLAEKLVSGLLLENEPPGLRRSLRMRLLAAQLVQRFGRARVLEWYLNSAYYGHLAYGAESAARLYLGKSASDLTLAEAALLAVLPNTPALNPLDAPAAALENQQAALLQLAEQGWISSEEYEAARQQELKLASAPANPPQFAAAYTDLVLSQLAARLGQQRVERGGLRIITTLDEQQQFNLQCTARAQLLRLTGQPDQISLPDGSACAPARLLPTLPPDQPQLAANLSANALLLDLKTGQVLAMLGDVNAAGLPVTVSTHQPGSLLSPFVAVAGFARGESPASMVWDIPPAAGSPLADLPNPDGQYHGPQRLRLAIANDYLTGLSQMLSQIGPADVWRLAAPFGLTSLDYSPQPDSLLFEGGSTSLLEIARAYSTFANLGSQIGQRSNRSEVQPVLVLQVEDLNGRILLQAGPAESQAILGEQIAYLVHHVLNDETARQASLGYPNPLQIGRPAGAKLGQARQNQQVWTVGYTRSHLIVTWLGWPDDQTDPARLEPKAAAGLWYALMQDVSRQQPVEDWPRPAGMTTLDVCNPSGLLPTYDCPFIVSEIFINGSEPVSYDNLYQSFQINRETDQLATVFTPLELIEEQTYMIVPPEAQKWAESAGIQLPPDAYDLIQLPSRSENANIGSPAIFTYVRGTVEVQGTAAGEGFAAYQLQVGEGLNPLTWLQIAEGSQPVQDGLLGAWQTGKDGLYAMRLLVTNQTQQLETAVIQITVDNSPPRLSVPYPTAGQEFSFSQHKEITLQAKADDAVGLARVEWHINGRKVGETSQMPFSHPWAATPGSHTLVVKAFDLAGNSTESTPIKFSVNQ